MENNSTVTLDSATDAAHAYVAKKNGVTDGASYIASLRRKTTGEYVVMPDGSIEMLRVTS